jgi:hypothetical protein
MVWGGQLPNPFPPLTCVRLSEPIGAFFLSCAPVAQGIERLPPEQKAAGSNPAGGTTFDLVKHYLTRCSTYPLPR